MGLRILKKKRFPNPLHIQGGLDVEGHKEEDLMHKECVSDPSSGSSVKKVQEHLADSKKDHLSVHKKIDLKKLLDLL